MKILEMLQHSSVYFGLARIRLWTKSVNLGRSLEESIQHRADTGVIWRGTGRLSH